MVGGGPGGGGSVGYPNIAHMLEETLNKLFKNMVNNIVAPILFYFMTRKVSSMFT
jgi:hypothetical protein